MDLNTINQYFDLFNLRNLNNCYVVIKKYTNVTYYYGCRDVARPTRCAHSSRWTNAKNAILFHTMDEAQKKCDELNAYRKRIKFRVESASKHFVSNFALRYINYAEKPVQIINNPVSLQDYKDDKKQVNIRITPEMVTGINSTLLKLIVENSHFIDNIANITQIRLQELEIDYNKRVQELNVRLTQELNDKQNRRDAANVALKCLSDGTIEKLLNNTKTINDNKFEILYGKGNNNVNS